ncbi:MAG: endolytic transglycosylase MltG [Patescibacteria group bacterium]
MPGPTGRTLIPRNFGPYKGKPKKTVGSSVRTIAPIIGTSLVLALALFSLPSILSLDIKEQQASAGSKVPFPVSVDPSRKVITENASVDDLLSLGQSSKSAAAVELATSLFSELASFVAGLPIYKLLAGTDVQFVTIRPGYRQEEVAQVFGNALGWNNGQRKVFVAQVKSKPPTLTEGEFVPGTYEVHGAASPTEVQNVLHERFTSEILDRYSTSTAEQVPLNDALTIASLIERETGGTDDMRMISGIIWNRIFTNMNLQIDATLQYAKAQTTKSAWWPPVVPKDKYIKSAYNTYAHPGLPPTPIANPSVAAVIAALNPKQTDCIFYFHDKNGEFHCSATYAEHVKTLKKYYGRGK